MKKILLLLIASMLIFGCNSQKRAAKKLEKKITAANEVFDQNPIVFANKCAVEFPPKTSTDKTTNTVVGPVDTINNKTEKNITGSIIDLIQHATDNTRQHIIDSLKKHPFIVIADCPPVYVPHDTIKVYETKTVENTAAIISLTANNDTLLAKSSKLEQKNADKDVVIKEQKKKALKLQISVGVLALLIVLYIALKIFNKIP